MYFIGKAWEYLFTFLSPSQLRLLLIGAGCCHTDRPGDPAVDLNQNRIVCSHCPITLKQLEPSKFAIASHTQKLGSLASNFPLASPLKLPDCQLILITPSSTTGRHGTLAKQLNFWGLRFFIWGPTEVSIILFLFISVSDSFYYNENLRSFRRNLISY